MNDYHNRGIKKLEEMYEEIEGRMNLLGVNAEEWAADAADLIEGLDLDDMVAVRLFLEDKCGYDPKRDKFDHAIGSWLNARASHAISYERTWFTVNEDHTITVHGWLGERHNDWPGFENDTHPRYTLVTVFGDTLEYPPSRDGITLTEWAEPFSQYLDDFHYEEMLEMVATFYRDGAGKHFPLKDVDESTPSGNYWCYFEEE